MGNAWFRVVGRTVEPVTWQGWAAFYVMITWITGGVYYAFTGRDPLGLQIDVPLLGAASLAIFVACAVLCVVKTDFSRGRD